MKKNILVTGGAGFIGSHLVDRLVKKGHNVKVLDNLEPQVHGRKRRLPDYANKKATYIIGDVRKRRDVTTCLEGVEYVLHLAAAVGIGQSMYEIERFTDVNCRGTGLLMEEIIKRKDSIKKIIVASSNTIYGEGRYRCKNCGIVHPDFRGEKQLMKHDWKMRCPECGRRVNAMPTPEDKPLKPTTVYAITKKTQEDLVLAIGRAYSIPCVALRCFNVYGPRQSLNNPYTGVTAIFQSNIKNGNPPIIYEDGLQSRDFIEVSDVVDAYLLAMKEKGMDYQVYNVGSGHATTISEIAHVLAKLYGKDIKPHLPAKFRKGDIRHCTANISKIKKCGYKPRTKFEYGMRKLVEWGKKQDAVDLTKKALEELKNAGLIEK
ncbi:MAG: SDR family NAD(P)-dependent oxidoreductase [Candidatus Altiarchaeota archaeon]|nr:SDR family NAD(P)-dependent oxidoreductase [Candidatus Altiarchaeota archaeon]